MRTNHSNLITLHTIAFLLLLAIWACGEAIKTKAGTPFVALYYVLHIFLGSGMSILILFEWLLRNQDKLTHIHDMHTHTQVWINKKLHRAYYLILLALPITGIAVFFDFIAARPFYQIHSVLFTILVMLVIVNLCSMVIANFKVK